MQVNSAIEAEILDTPIISNASVSKVLFEWNLNMFHDATVTNYNEPEDSVKAAKLANYNNDFPIESVVGNWRFSGPICYPIANPAYDSLGINKLYSYGSMSYDLRETLPARTYIAGKDTVYHYWVSSPYSLSTSAGAISNVNPMVEYADIVNANKILVRFNTHAYRPSAVNIEIRVDGSWTTIFTNLSVPASGIVEVYGTTTGWTSTPTYYTETYDNLKSFDGIRVGVTSMTGPGAQVELVEISPRLVADMTKLTKTWSSSMENGDRDYIDPVGLMSANEGQIVLSNSTGLFDENNTASPFHSIMDSGVEVTVDLAYGSEIIRVLTAVTELWSTVGWTDTTVTLYDHGRVFQGIKCSDLLFVDYRATNIIWALADMIGFSNTVVHEAYTYNLPSPTVRYFSATNQETVWEAMQRVATAYQLSVFFDELGVLHIADKEYMFGRHRTADWTFRGQDGTHLADIASFQVSEKTNVNKVVVTYQGVTDYKIGESTNDQQTRNQIFWEAPDDYGVGAAKMAAPISAGAQYVTVDATRPENMPHWSGTLYINGNYFDYYGKGYMVNGVERILKNDADWQLAIEANNGISPTFSGRLYLTATSDVTIGSLTDRLNQFSLVYNLKDTTSTYSAPSLFTYSSGATIPNGIRIAPPTGRTTAELEYTRRMALKDFGFTFDRLGAKFVNAGDFFGLVFWPQGTGLTGGYWIGVANGDDPTISAVTAYTQFIRFNPDGTRYYPVRTYWRPVETVSHTHWNYVEVVVGAHPSGGWAFNVYINGQFCARYVDIAAGYLSQNTRGGFGAMGAHSQYIQRFYAVNMPFDAMKDASYSYSIYPDDTFLYVKNAVANTADYAAADQAVTNYLGMIRDGNIVDSFVCDLQGSYYGVAQEAFEEDVRFDNGPGMNLEVLTTNAATSVMKFDYTPFGAKFIVKNDSDKYQPLKGTWQTNIENAEIQESFLIFGKAAFFTQDQKIESADENVIKRRGESAIEFNAPLIQTREAAYSVSEWVKQRFGRDTETFAIETIGNPLIQVGDMATIDYAAKSLTADNTLGVISRISRAWDGGQFSTSVEVSRVPLDRFYVQYYSGTALAGNPIYTEYRAAIDFADFSSQVPSVTVPTTSVSFRATNNILFENADYQFTVHTDDGIRLYVDGQIVIDEWIDQTSTQYQATVSMSGGEHEIKVEWYNNTNPGVCTVTWAKV